MHTSTAAAAGGAATVRCSPSSSTDHTSVSRGWTGCNWLASRIPIAAMPRYRTTRPGNREPTATHSGPATLCAVRCTPVRRDALTPAPHLDLPEPGLPHISSDGYHLWLRLPEGTDEPALTAAALRAGVAIAPDRPYVSAEPTAGHVRLSFVAVVDPGGMVEGVRRLRTARNEVLPAKTARPGLRDLRRSRP